MKIRIMQDDAPIYLQVGPEAVPVRVLHHGDVVELGKVKNIAGKKWVEVIQSDGTSAFMSGETRIFSLMRVATSQRETPLYAFPSRDVVKTTLKKRTLLDFQNIVEQNGEQWIQVQDTEGHQGYIEGKTKIVQKQVVTKKTGLQNMLIGGAFFIIGTIVTIATYSSATSAGGSYYICWGAVIFGAIQFVQGLIQYLTAKE